MHSENGFLISESAELISLMTVDNAIENMDSLLQKFIVVLCVQCCELEG